MGRIAPKLIISFVCLKNLVRKKKQGKKADSYLGNRKRLVHRVHALDVSNKVLCDRHARDTRLVLVEHWQGTSEWRPFLFSFAVVRTIRARARRQILRDGQEELAEEYVVQLHLGRLTPGQVEGGILVRIARSRLQLCTLPSRPCVLFVRSKQDDGTTTAEIFSCLLSRHGDLVRFWMDGWLSTI